jgi:cell division protein FtsL
MEDQIISLDKITLGFTLLTMLFVVIHWISFCAHKIDVEYDIRSILSKISQKTVQSNIITPKKVVKVTKTVKKVKKPIKKKKL